MIFRTLRGRLILSHILPLLVVIPLMGVVLIYVLETHVMIPELFREMRGEATLMAQLARERPAIWSDPDQARGFVHSFGPMLKNSVTLIGPDGRILASTDPEDAARVGSVLVHPGLATALRGATELRMVRGRNVNVEVADILQPVTGADGRISGLIRITVRAPTFVDELLRRRYLIAGILTGGLLLGTTIGWVLAESLTRPLQQVATSVQELAKGERWVPLPEPHLEEMSLLVRAFNKLVERLRGVEEARRQLLANLVHELGRPLGALLSATQALQRGAAEQPDLRSELLSGMDAEIDRMGRLLNDLSHIHDRLLRPIELDRREVAVREWLLQLLPPWREAAQRKGLRWGASIPDLPTARIDPDRLGQAVGNLISNAIKFTPPGGTVTISAGVEEGEVWISVSDSGPGIPPEDRQRIFEPFYRGRADRRFPSGMGLGLTIARELVTAHAGRLELESNHGARFTIRIPLRHPPDT